MTYGWFGLVASIVMFVLMAALFVEVLRFSHMGYDVDRSVWRKRRKRMFLLIGIWQCSVGILLIAMDSWINSIGLFGVGILMVLLSRLSEAWLP